MESLASLLFHYQGAGLARLVALNYFILISFSAPNLALKLTIDSPFSGFFQHSGCYMVSGMAPWTAAYSTRREHIKRWQVLLQGLEKGKGVAMVGLNLTSNDN